MNRFQWQLYCWWSAHNENKQDERTDRTKGVRHGTDIDQSGSVVCEAGKRTGYHRTVYSVMTRTSRMNDSLQSTSAFHSVSTHILSFFFSSITVTPGISLTAAFQKRWSHYKRFSLIVAQCPPIKEQRKHRLYIHRTLLLRSRLLSFVLPPNTQAICHYPDRGLAAVTLSGHENVDFTVPQLRLLLIKGKMPQKGGIRNHLVSLYSLLRRIMEKSRDVETH